MVLCLPTCPDVLRWARGDKGGVFRVAATQVVAPLSGFVDQNCVGPTLARFSQHETATPTSPGYVVRSSEGCLSHEVGNVRVASEGGNALAADVVIERATGGTKLDDRRASGCGNGCARWSGRRSSSRRLCGHRCACGDRRGSRSYRRRTCGERRGSRSYRRPTCGERRRSRSSRWRTRGDCCRSGSCRSGAGGNWCGGQGCRRRTRGSRSECDGRCGCIRRSKDQGLHSSLNPSLDGCLGVRGGCRRVCRYRGRDGCLNCRIYVRCGFGWGWLAAGCRVAGSDRDCAANCQKQNRH